MNFNADGVISLSKFFNTESIGSCTTNIPRCTIEFRNSNTENWKEGIVGTGSERGKMYRGKQNKLPNGVACLNWKDTSNGLAYINDSAYDDEGLE
jgi:hypothetical protein